MEKTIQRTLIINYIFAFLILITDICFMTINCSIYITKTIASALFVLCGLYNILCFWKDNKNLKFKIFLFIGLIFAFIGDILLIDYFILGAIFFAIGHIFYFVSFCFVSKFKIKDFIYGILLFILVLLLIELYPYFEFEGMKNLILIYALVISLMLGKSISNAFCKENKKLNIIILLGSFLFFFSDAMLLFYVFSGHNKIFDYLCLATYYPAQFILAFSVFLVTLLKKQNPPTN